MPGLPSKTDQLDEMKLLILLMWAVMGACMYRVWSCQLLGSHTALAYVLACTHAHACRRVGSSVMVVVVRSHASREGLWVGPGSAVSLMERGAAEGSAAEQQTMSQCIVVCGVRCGVVWCEV